ncbi:MAG: hypothetical protein H0T11_03820, partial [Chthoniobacterales bacterium]|nr:hypothetical protein [Chthoniobacterales bacterium]
KGIQDAAATMDAERQRLELENVGKTARRRAIEEHIAEQAARIAARVKEDPIAAELEKVVQAREVSVKRAQKLHESAAAPASDVSDAVATAAEARAKLLQRRLDAGTEVGGETLEALNRELTTLSIDLHEIEARFDFVKKELEKLSEATRALSDISYLEAAIAEAREMKKQTTATWERVQWTIGASSPPRIDVIFSDDRKTSPKDDLFGE